MIVSRPKTVMNHGIPAAGSWPEQPRILAHAKRGEVRDRLSEAVGELVPRRAQLRDPQAPGRERRAHARELVAEPPLGAVDGRPDAVVGRDDVDAQAPALARLELDPERHGRVGRLAALGEDDLGEPVEVRVLAGEHELVVAGLVDGLDRRRQRARVLRVPEREVVLLDGEDVREVVPELHREVEGDQPAGVVRDDDVLLHRVADEALAADRELVLHEPARHGVPEEERRRVVLHLARGEHERPGAVDLERPVREEARVVGEEAHRRARRCRRARRRRRTSSPRGW